MVCFLKLASVWKIPEVEQTGLALLSLGEKYQQR